MGRIAIFAALRWECRPILRHLRRVTRRPLGRGSVWVGQRSGHDVWLVKTGVGQERAKAAARAVSAAGPFDVFLSTGCAGALSPRLAPGDLVIATAIIGNPSPFETDADCRMRASRAAERAGLQATLGPVLCSPQVLATVAAKRAAAAETGAVAVEMEGFPIAACAADAGIPFASVRVILDTVDTELDMSGDFIDRERGAIKPLELVRLVIRQPTALSRLRALQRMMAAGQQGLETFFGALLAAP